MTTQQPNHAFAERRGNRMTTAPKLPEDETDCLAVGSPVDRRVMPLRAAYADPPYLGCGQKHYGALHEQASDYDDPETHRRLIERLCDEFDCWALSLHEPSLRTLLAMCPEDVRVGSWVKPFAAFKANVTRAWTWEPVIFRFSADRPRARIQPTWRDHVAEPIAMRRGFPGAKPEKVCFWIFEGLNLRHDDELHDLFPGSGAVGEAWEKWRHRVNLPEQMQMLLRADAGAIPGVAEA